MPLLGPGQRILLLFWELGDGIKTLKGQALTLAHYYKAYANKFKVYVFGRKVLLPQGYMINDMAMSIDNSTEFPQSLALELLIANQTPCIGLFDKSNKKLELNKPSEWRILILNYHMNYRHRLGGGEAALEVRNLD